MRHLDAPSRKNILKSTTSQYLIVFFNFSFLSLVLYEILWGSQIYIRGRCAPLDSPWWKNFYTQNEYFGISNCIFNFHFLALVVSEISGGPKFTLGDLRTLDAP